MNVSVLSLPIGVVGGQAAPPVNGQSLDQTSDPVPFGALLIGLINGNGDATLAMPSWPWSNAALPPERQEAVIEQSENANAIAGALGDNETAILEAIAALLAALPQEMLEPLEQHPQVRSWSAWAEAELTMSGLEPEPLVQEAPGNAGRSAGTARPDAPLVDIVALLRRLAMTIKGFPEHPQTKHLAAVASEGIRLLSDLLSERPELREGLRRLSAAGRAGESMTRLIAALERMDGTMTMADKVVEPAPKARAVSLLQAMDARANLGLLESVRTASEGEVAAAAERKPATEPLIPAAPPQVENGEVKPAAKEEPLPQRIPVRSFGEAMGVWVVRQAVSGKEMTETTIRLVPEHLGQVEVKLTLHNGQLTATFTAETASAKELLEAGLGQLRLNLQNAGIHVDKLEVTQQNASSGLFQDGRQERRAGGEPEQRSRNGESDEPADWRDYWETVAEGVADPRWMTGSSFSATA